MSVSRRKERGRYGEGRVLCPLTLIPTPQTLKACLITLSREPARLSILQAGVKNPAFHFLITSPMPCWQPLPHHHHHITTTITITTPLLSQFRDVFLEPLSYFLSLCLPLFPHLTPPPSPYWAFELPCTIASVTSILGVQLDSLPHRRPSLSLSPISLSHTHVRVCVSMCMCVSA